MSLAHKRKMQRRRKIREARATLALIAIQYASREVMTPAWFKMIDDVNVAIGKWGIWVIECVQAISDSIRAQVIESQITRDQTGGN